jgi:thioredoxin 1
LPYEDTREERQTNWETKMFSSIHSDDFGEYVSQSKGLVVVNFWTLWSDECRYMSSLMADVKHLLDEKDSIVQVDWDHERQLAEDLDVLGVPTLLLFVGGNEVARYYGTMSEEDLGECLSAAKKTDHMFR